MKATIVDLRYKMKDVLQALDRMEDVEILYRGKPKGILKPVGRPVTSRSVRDHPFFGSKTKAETSVAEQITALRSGRYRDL
jgi:hypothetical protein